MREFDVIILKDEPHPDKDRGKIYRVRDEMNKRHSEKVCGETILRFIVIVHDLIGQRNVYYLSYRTTDLSEAEKFQDEAVSIYKSFE